MLTKSLIHILSLFCLLIDNRKANIFILKAKKLWFHGDFKGQKIASLIYRVRELVENGHKKTKIRNFGAKKHNIVRGLLGKIEGQNNGPFTDYEKMYTHKMVCIRITHDSLAFKSVVSAPSQTVLEYNCCNNYFGFYWPCYKEEKCPVIMFLWQSKPDPQEPFEMDRGSSSSLCMPV